MVYVIYLNDSKRIEAILRLKTIQGVLNRIKNWSKPLNYKKGVDTYHIYRTNNVYDEKQYQYVKSVKA